MSNIVRDSDVVEISAPPVFAYGEKVKAKRMIRNDGTYAGKEIGEALVKHPGTDLIALTGSTETGKRVAAEGVRRYNEAIYRDLGIDNLLCLITEPTLEGCS